MIERLLSLDESIFLFFNGLHSQWADVFFYWVSNRFFWIPLYAFLLFLIIKRHGKRALYILLLIILGVAVTDQTCTCIKKSVQRPRPSHNEKLEQRIHLTDYPDGNTYRGGQYGFPSSHAANSIAVALFAIFFAVKGKKWAIALLIFWAVLLGYSRLYLGVHYPSDLLTGYLIGATYAFLLIKSFHYCEKRKERRKP